MSESTIPTAVEVTLDDGFKYPSIQQTKELTHKDKFARLKPEQQDQILSGSKTVADFYKERSEKKIKGTESLQSTCDFIDRYQGPVNEAIDSRKAQAVQELANGAEPAAIQAIVGVNFHTLKSWCAPTLKGKTVKLVEQKILNSIDAAAKKAKTSS